MPHGRFSRLLLIPPSLLAIGLPCTGWADGFCGSDEIAIYARADTVFVEHANSLMNCCKALSIRVTADGSVICFYESDQGQPCRCMCCFDYRYLAAGFPAGRYDVFVYDATGSRLFGEGSVDVEGPGGEPHLVGLDEGACANAQDADAKRWGEVRLLFR